MQQQEETPTRFSVPVIYDNPAGWGPTEESIPQKFLEIPYAPFSKGDKIGKVADFGGYNTKLYQRGGQKDNLGFTFAEEENFGFRLVVDSHPTQKKMRGYRTRANWRTFPKKTTRRRGDALPQNKPNYGKHHEQRRQHQNTGWQRGYRRPPGGRRFDRDKIAKESSVEVKMDWIVEEQFEFSHLQKLKADAIPEATDLLKCGLVGYYDKAFDRITVKTKKPLKPVDKTFFKVTTADDPIMKKLALEAKSEGNVIFGTDAIISLLMCAPRSQYSWDIVVRRVGSKLFFDKRDKSQFDYLTVNETASEPPRDDDKEPMNTPSRLSHEASSVNQYFSQQVLVQDKKFAFPEHNPFQGSLSAEEVASVGYRYRKWDLGGGNELICRCEIDAVDIKQGQEEYYTVKALNEYDPKVTGVDWRQKLDSQRGAVLATELKNNSCKLARWTAQALLAGTQEIKLGYISRASAKDAKAHQILGVQTYKIAEFANQINLNENNMWAILKHIIGVCMDLEDGMYVLLKDPNKPLVRLYYVPPDAFAEGKEDEMEDEEYLEVDEDNRELGGSDEED